MRAHSPPTSHPKLAGHGMLEVLIALVVISLGMLGAAALQATSKRAALETKQRLIATFLANDIIERMRNNPAALASYAGSNVGGGTIAAEPSPNCSGASPCQPAQLAVHDRWLWEQSIDGAAIRYGTTKAGGLVKPTGCISQSNGQIQVVISWHGSEQTSDTGAGAAGNADCGTASASRRQLVVDTFIS